MPSGQLHLKEIFGSLRLRLTLWNTAVVLLLELITLWGVREGMRLSLWNEADEQLVEDAREVALTVERHFPNDDKIRDELTRKAITHTHRGFHIRLFDSDDKLLWTSPNAPPVPFPTSYFAYGLKPVSAGQYRLVHIRTDNPPYMVRVGTSFEPLEDDIAQITELLLAIGGISLIISPLGGYWLAGRATRPIAQIIDTTARLHPASLAERLPLRGTGDELDRLSRTINGFLDRLAKYIKQNREFTANAAHELRSPLAAIQNSLEVALNADRELDEYKELLAEVLDECENLRVLVNQLLLLAEGDDDGRRTAAELVQLDRIVRKSHEMFLGVAEAAEVNLRIARLDPVRTRGDAGRLRQVVNNLIDNAIKFTRPGGMVELQLAADSAAGLARLVVRDTGIGIPAAELPHIFERFYRGDKSRQRLSRGTGLGLAICHAIVVGYKGRIEVDSGVDKGTTFTVILPLAADAVEGTRPEFATESPQHALAPAPHEVHAG